MHHLILAVVVALAPTSGVVSAAAEEPEPTNPWWQYTVNEDVVTLGGTSTENGSNNTSNRLANRADTDGPTIAEEPERRWTPPPIERGNGCEVTPGDWAAVECTGTRAAPPPPAAPAGTPGVTIRDVASFRPELAVLRSEPDGWAVRGLDANILATGGSSTRTGELFGITAEVRFTPVAYTFDYGDGSAPLSAASPGSTWATLGLDEFDPTPTSHVYTAAGTYTVTLLVDYAAEYRVGGGAFIPIPGTLAIPSAPIDIVVADSATTALVDRSCRADPAGPGC